MSSFFPLYMYFGASGAQNTRFFDDTDAASSDVVHSTDFIVPPVQGFVKTSSRRMRSMRNTRSARRQALRDQAIR